MPEPGSIVPERPFAVPLTYLSPSLSSSFPDFNLVDSIPREDLPALLPIIKVAFPFITDMTLAEVGVSTNEHGVHSSGPGFVHSEDSRMQQLILHDVDVDELFQDEERLTPSSLSVDVRAFSGQKKVEGSILTAASSCNFTGQVHMFHGKACHAGSTFDECCDQLPYYACLSTVETDPQIAISSMTELETDLSAHMSPHLRMMDMQAMTVLDGGNDVRKCSNFSSTNASPLSRSTECSNVADEPHPSTSFSTAEWSGYGPFRYSVVQNTSELSRQCDMTIRPFKRLLKTMDRNTAAVRETEVPVVCGRRFKAVSPLDLNETQIKKVQSGSVSSSKGCSDEFPSLDAADCTSLDSTMQEHGVERCHRTNGKQWRCSKTTFSGTSYCKRHLEYVNRGALYASQCPKLLCLPNNVSNTLESCGGIHETPHSLMREGSGQKHGGLKRAVLEFSRNKEEFEEESVHRPRCRRSDGKLWQCSKQAIQGSIYCEHHSSKARRFKKTGKHDEDASVTKQGARKISSKGKEDARACSLNIPRLDRNEQQVCGERVVSREHGSAMTVVHQAISEEKERFEVAQSSEEVVQAVKKTSRLVARDMGWSENSVVRGHCIETVHVVQCQWAEANGLKCRKLSKSGSVFCEHHQPSMHDITHVLAVSPDTTQCDIGVPIHNLSAGIVHVEVETKEEASKEQCQRKDGKGWQCSQAPKHGFRYCEHHVLYLSKRNAKNSARKKQSGGAARCEVDKNQGTPVM